jgi:ketosteroid isomerase-like protein
MCTENKQLIDDYMQALSRSFRGEREDLGRFFTDDVRWHLPQSTANFASASDHVGKQAVLGMLEGDVEEFYRPDTIEFEHHSLIAEDDRVHLHFSMKATTRNGREYRNRYQTLFRLSDGKIAEAWESLDTAYLFSLFQE